MYPMPPPPWQQPQFGANPQQYGANPQQYGAMPQEYGALPPPSGKDVRGKMTYILIAVGIVTVMLGIGGLGYLARDNNIYLMNGARVTPTADHNMVYVDQRDLDKLGDVQCTATTDSGETLTGLEPAKSHTTSRGYRSNVKYRSKAALPTDKGPLIVKCAAADGAAVNYEMALNNPDSGWGALWILLAYPVGLAIMCGGIFLMRRRYFRKYPRPESGFRM